jgi:transcriptional regulator with XRE-family HTH domain
MPINELAIVPNTDSEPMPRAEEKPISAYILRVMKEEGWSQADVLKNAKALKIHLRQATLSEILTGETENPRIFTLIDISRALNRSFEEMVEAIQGTEAANAASFSQSDFALMNRIYERITAKQAKQRADDLVDMVKSKLIEILKQQGETNLYQLRK